MKPLTEGKTRGNIKKDSLLRPILPPPSIKKNKKEEEYDYSASFYSETPLESEIYEVTFSNKKNLTRYLNKLDLTTYKRIDIFRITKIPGTIIGFKGDIKITFR